MPTGIYLHKKTGRSPMKGKHHSEETRKKISKSLLGVKLSEKHRQRISETHKGLMAGKKNYFYGKIFKGNENYNWKGDKVGYRALHRWVEKWKGKSETCENCGKIGLKGHNIHWANIDHQYKRVLEDWIRLCTTCHAEYDSKLRQKSLC